MTTNGPREIRAPIDLVAGARVAPAALGWSRSAVHRCDVAGPWGRRKRWHHWCVQSDCDVLAVTVLDADVLTALIITAIDRSRRRTVQQIGVRPGGLGDLPDVADRGVVTARAGSVRVEIDDQRSRARLVVRSPRIDADVDVVRRDGVDTLGVATAWPGTDGARYAYSSKQIALGARGRIRVDGACSEIPGGAFASLDWGRGVWPQRTSWNWAAAAAVLAGRTVGLNLGARWTHGVNENAVWVDGRMTKIHDDVGFAWDPMAPERPWRLRGDGVDLTLQPEKLEGAALPLVGRLVIAFGTFSGRAAGVRFDGAFGWAEQLDVRW